MLMTYRVWKCFKDETSNIAVVVDATGAADALKQGKELMEDERQFGGHETKAVSWVVEQLTEYKD